MCVTRQVEDILHERGIDICYETVRFWVDRFGSKFAKEIRKKRADQHSNWQWHLDEVFVKINGERFYRCCQTKPNPSQSAMIT